MKYNLYLFFITVVLLIAEEENESYESDLIYDRFVEAFHNHQL